VPDAAASRPVFFLTSGSVHSLCLSIPPHTALMSARIEIVVLARLTMVLFLLQCAFTPQPFYGYFFFNWRRFLLDHTGEYAALQAHNLLFFSKSYPISSIFLRVSDSLPFFL